MGIGGVMATELPRKQTTLTPAQAISALATGYRRVTGKPPSYPILFLLTGQSAFETGNWTSMSNYAMAGVKATASDPYYQVLMTTEGYGASAVRVPQKFAAYRSPEDGAEAYIRLLKRRSHWWKALQTGSVTKYVTALTSPPLKYFTGNPADYVKGIPQRAQAYLPTIQSLSTSASSAVRDGLIALILTGGIWYGSKKVKKALQA